MTKDAIHDAPAVQNAGAKRIRPEGMTRAQWKKRRRVQKITKFWPKLFDIKNPKPLKINIMQDMVKDIQARGLDMGVGSVRVALNAYTSHAKYVRCVAAGGMRYDLNGQPCEEVTETAIKNATERYKILEQKFRAVTGQTMVTETVSRKGKARQMADEVDIASEKERERIKMLLLNGVRNSLPDIGQCYNCGESISAGLFCDADCRDDYEKREGFRGMNSYQSDDTA